MTRRQAIALLSAPALASTGAASVLVDLATRRPIVIDRPDRAGRFLAPPGSTMKPFAIAALIEAGKLRASDTFVCPGDLAIGGHRLACSHPRGLAPMTARTAIAYSCNCFLAHFAQRLAPGELARYGLTSRTGWIDGEAAGELGRADVRLQALGEEGVRVTVAGLAMAYTRLAATSVAAVREGLEDAVEYGTAQRARIEGVKLAGKTGSVRGLAWFAGYTPKYAIAVLVQGNSGGADAAPVAREILERHL